MNYQEVVDGGRAYADRNDIEVDDNLDLFLVMIESRINRLLRTREQTARGYITAAGNTEYYSLPPDFGGMRDIQVNSDAPSAEHKSYPVDLVTPQLMNVYRNQPFAGRYYYTVIADQLQLYPEIDPPCTIEMVYYQRVPPLTPAANENWMSISHPDAYVAGMVAEIEFFAKNYEAGNLWYSRVDSIINEMETSDVMERWGGSPLQMRTDRDTRGSRYG